MPNSNLVFKPLTYNVEETSDTFIYICGHTPDSKLVKCKVYGYTISCFLEFPQGIWNKQKASIVYNTIIESIKNVDHKPVDWKYELKKNLYGLSSRAGLWLHFKTKKSASFLPSTISRLEQKNAIVGGCKVHEQGFDILVKFFCDTDIKPSGFVKIKKYIVQDDIVICNVSSISAIESSAMPKRKGLSFDIECYSKNHNSKLPDPNQKENPCFQIGATIFNDIDDEQDRYIHTLYNCPPIDGVTVINYPNEKELLLGFCKFISDHDFDIFLGYNTLKFDWSYIIRRCDMYGILQQLYSTTRISALPSSIASYTWSSSAYKTQQFEYLNLPGRLNIDLMIEISRNYKFDKYSLDHVSKMLLKESKDDVSPKQLFKLIQIVQLYEKQHLGKKSMTIDEMECFKTVVDKLIDEEDAVNGDGEETILKGYKEKVLYAESSKDFIDAVYKGIWYVSRYCIQDTNLPIRILKKINVIPGMEQMVNVVCTPLDYLQVRGQQIRVLSQVYRCTQKKGIFIPHKKYSKESVKKYQGATVFKAIPDDYNMVSTLDFASLYPSIMIAYNICWTTYINDEDGKDENVKDEDCHIIEIKEHVNCEHDKEVVCGNKKCLTGKVQKKVNLRGEEEEFDRWLCHEATYRFYKKEVRLGLLPEFLTNILSERKKVKRKMIEHETYLKMHNGVALEDDYNLAKRNGWKIYKPKELTKEQVNDFNIVVVFSNALQLALKVSANSCYGTLGAKTGCLPLMKGASSITAMGRYLIGKTADKAEEMYPNSKLVYGDTDSVMITYKDSTLSEAFEMARNAAKVISDMLPHPLELEFENMYSRFFLLSKKRYVAVKVNDKGQFVGKTEKGVCLARGDKTKFLKDVYRNIVDMIMDNKTEDEVKGKLYEWCNKLFTNQIPSRNLVIYMSVQDPDSYVKSTPPQVMLARRMIARGEDVPSNTRLEFVYVKNRDKNAKQGERIEDYTFFRDNRRRYGIELDPLNYMEHQLLSPISELFKVKYNRGFKKWVDCTSYIYGSINKLPKYIKIDSLSRPSKKEQIEYLITLLEPRIEKKIALKKKEKPDNTSIDVTGVEVDVKKVCVEYLKTNDSTFYNQIYGYGRYLDSDLMDKLYFSPRQSIIEKIRTIDFVIRECSDHSKTKNLKKELIREKNKIIITEILKRHNQKAKQWNKIRTKKQKETELISIGHDFMIEYTKTHERKTEVIDHLKDLFSPFSFDD